jgi:hypothetical protein
MKPYGSNRTDGHGKKRKSVGSGGGVFLSSLDVYKCVKIDRLL